MPHPLFDKHRATLDRALQAIAERGYWSRVSRSRRARKVYGEGAAEAGKAAFDALLGKPFRADAAGARSATVGGERSPFGIDARRHLSASPTSTACSRPSAQAHGAVAQGRARSVGRRVPRDPRPHQQGELRDRQRGHAHDRPGVHDGVPGGRPARAGSRARGGRVRVGRDARACPPKAQWEKPQGKNEPIRMEKHFRVVPRGIGLVIGCCTFPTWNGYPGLFASLATGNAVVVKPHPGAILPLAMTVKIAREVLAEAGFDPNVVTLFAHEAGDDTAQKLALRPEVQHHRLHRQHRERPLARGARARRRRSTPRRRASTRSSSTRRADLEGGRAQRRVLAVAVHRPDVHGAAEHLRAARRHRHRRGPPVVRPGRGGDRGRRAQAPRRSRARGRGAGRRAERAARCAGSRRRARSARSCSTRSPIAHPAFPDATVRTPLIVRARRRRPRDVPQRMVRPDRVRHRDRLDTTQSLAIARDAVRGHGALTLSVYSTDDDVIEQRDRRCRGRGRRAVDQPHRRRVRQPVGGVLGFPRHRRESRGERSADRRGVRREPLPRRAAPDACLSA